MSDPVLRRWEYRQEALDASRFLADLNRLGAQGWELVRESQIGAVYYCLLKREVSA